MNTSHPGNRPRRLLRGAALSAVVVAIAACGGSNDNGASPSARPMGLIVF